MPRLDADARRALVGAVAREAEARPAAGFWSTVGDPTVLLLGLVYFGVRAPNVTLTLWMPQIVKSLGCNTTEAGFVAAIPYVFGMIGMLVWPRLSDRLGSRIGMTAAALAIAAAGVAAGGLLADPKLKIAAFSVGAFGAFAANPTFWTLPARLLAGFAAGAALLCAALLRVVARHGHIRAVAVTFGSIGIPPNP